MKLLEKYALESGLKIKNPYIREKFFPLNDSFYFTVQSSSGQQAKNYDYWNDVIELILPYLQRNNIALIQLGTKDDIPLKYCKHLMGQTTINQAVYILKRSLLHFGTDSWMAHFCGANEIPLVALYGTTSIINHSPYKYNKDKTILLESHRNGNLPSFGFEQYKTVNQIKPEEIAKSIYKLLNIDYKSSINTIFIGPYYNQSIIEWVPDGVFNPQFNPQMPLTARMDLFFNESNLFNTAITGRKLNIITNKPININILYQIKNNIIGLNYEINDNDDINYISQLKKIGIKIRFFSKEKNNEKISNLRLKFFDVCFIEYMSDRTKQDFLNDAAKYLNFSLDLNKKMDTMFYRSNKFIISNGKIYLSKADWHINKDVSNFDANISNVIDNDDFWSEYQHFNIFEKL